jgi:hypothetical protein
MQQTPKVQGKLQGQRKLRKKVQGKVPETGTRILSVVSTLMTHRCVYTGTAAINAGWRDVQYDGIVAMTAGEHLGAG